MIDDKFATSVVMPHLLSVGSYIIKLDTDSISTSLDKAVKTVKEAPLVKEATDNIKNEVESTTNSVQQAVQEEVVKKIEEKVDETKEASKEQVDEMKEKLKSIANKPQ